MDGWIERETPVIVQSGIPFPVQFLEVVDFFRVAGPRQFRISSAYRGMLCQQVEQSRCSGLHGADHDEVASRWFDPLAAIYVHTRSVDRSIVDFQKAYDVRCLRVRLDFESARTDGQWPAFPSQKLPTAPVLDDKFRIERLLGMGGMLMRKRK